MCVRVRVCACAHVRACARARWCVRVLFTCSCACAPACLHKCVLMCECMCFLVGGFSALGQMHARTMTLFMHGLAGKPGSSTRNVVPFARGRPLAACPSSLFALTGWSPEACSGEWNVMHASATACQRSARRTSLGNALQ